MLKEDIAAGPTLAGPYPSRIFYMNPNWSKDIMGAVLLKAYDSVEARKTEAQEIVKYKFYKSLEVIHLWKIYFISRSMVSPLEYSRHSFVG